MIAAALALLARCRALGIDLMAGPGGALLWEADADPPADLLADLAAHKAELLDLLLPRCPACAGPVDSLGRCWRCCDRPCCYCGRPTGSAFIGCCLVCDYRGETGCPG
jgi:hypothetical protein